MDSLNIHEIGFIKSFIAKEKQERFLALIQKKNRKKLRMLLAHSIRLNKNNTLNTEINSEEQIYKTLKHLGASDLCHVICENSKYDEIETNLKDILHELYLQDYGYIISCIPGKLAYFQGEDTSAILFNQFSKV